MFYIYKIMFYSSEISHFVANRTFYKKYRTFSADFL